MRGSVSRLGFPIFGFLQSSAAVPVRARCRCDVKPFKEPLLIGAKVSREKQPLVGGWLAVATDNFAQDSLIDSDRPGELILMNAFFKDF
jgi:hypothetical protein